MMIRAIFLMGMVMLLFGNGELVADNSKIDGYPKPEVCLKSNIRCILKKQGDTKYWCLKSNQQRNLDARRTTTPIKKTRLENLGHCAKIIPLR